MDQGGNESTAPPAQPEPRRLVSEHRSQTLQIVMASDVPSYLTTDTHADAAPIAVASFGRHLGNRNVPSTSSAYAHTICKWRRAEKPGSSVGSSMCADE